MVINQRSAPKWTFAPKRVAFCPLLQREAPTSWSDPPQTVEGQESFGRCLATAARLSDPWVTKRPLGLSLSHSSPSRPVVQLSQILFQSVVHSPSPPAAFSQCVVIIVPWSEASAIAYTQDTHFATICVSVCVCVCASDTAGIQIDSVGCLFPLCDLQWKEEIEFSCCVHFSSLPSLYLSLSLPNEMPMSISHQKVPVEVFFL